VTTRATSLPAQLALLAGLALIGAVLAHRFAAEPLALDTVWSNFVATAAREQGMDPVDLDAVRTMVDNFSHLVLDARRASDYQTGRLPGALSLPVHDFDAHFAEIAALLTPEQPVLVYCSGEECEESLDLGRMLIAAGYTNISLFAGGMAAWTGANLPVEQ
jgi:rhodanese-related sulfurtransferase